MQEADPKNQSHRFQLQDLVARFVRWISGIEFGNISFYKPSLRTGDRIFPVQYDLHNWIVVVLVGMNTRESMVDDILYARNR